MPASPLRGSLAMLLLAAAFSGCSSSAANSNEILIGQYASLTGTEATFGQSTDNGVKLAVDEVNAAGGVNGKMIRLVTYDDKGDSKETGAAVTRLVTRDSVKAVIGEVASGLSLAGAPVCQEHGVPMVSPSSTNPKVTEIGDMIFRVCFTDPFQAYVCAKFAHDDEHLKVSKAAILFQQDQPYSVGLADWFEQEFVKLGGTIASKQSFNKGDQDFSAQLTAIRSSAPEVIYIPAYYTAVGNIASQARKLGLTMPLLGSDGWDSEDLAKIGGAAIEGCFYSNHYSHQDPNPRVQDFIARYKAKYEKTPDGLAALGYDAARILFQAMEHSPTTEGAAMAQALAATRDFDGVTGKITINGQRNAVKSAVIVQMQQGVPTYVTTIEPPR